MAEGTDKRQRKRSIKLSESQEGPESFEVKKKRKSLRKGGASDRGTTREEMGNKGLSGHPWKLLVSYNHVQHNLKLRSSLLEVGSATREDTPSSVASGSLQEGIVFPRRNVEVQFKNPDFAFSYLAANKKRTWKNLKQILAAERALPWKPDDPTYSSIDAPPPLKPPKKYADLTGFTAKYTDPMTGIYFSSTEEFQVIRSLPTNIIHGYLGLRGKPTI